jgi:hypothetical protein
MQAFDLIVVREQWMLSVATCGGGGGGWAIVYSAPATPSYQLCLTFGTANES